MKVLIIGSGGREHAILKSVNKSKKVSEVFVAPGNIGMKDEATLVDIKVEEIDKLCDFAKQNDIDMTIVGPEVPLVMGIYDLFSKNSLRVLGVDKNCAQFEGSKDFTKEFLMKYNVKTAKYETFTDYNQAIEKIGVYGYPMVIKADGLAAGKGVIIAKDETEAKKALEDIMVKRIFGDSKVVIEEFLDGIEASIICLVDGKTIVPLETAKDYKKALDGDFGPNTGGMGTFSPSNIIDDKMKEKIQEEILKPIINGFLAEKMNYKGILFIGIMIQNGEPKVLEFNVRFGDPETQVILPRLENDIIDVFNAVIDGKLDEVELNWSEKQAVCVVLTANGYPNAYDKGDVISFKEMDKNSTLLHAGTTEKNGEVVTNGGRVLNLINLAENILVARENVYQDINKVEFKGKTYRTDIAKV